MAKNQVYKPQRTRHLPVPDGTLSGAAVLVGSLIGVCLTTEATGGNADNQATVALDGAFKLAVATTTTGTIGAPVYITSGNAVTMSSSGNTLFGYLLEAKGSSAGQVCAIELAQV